jgi:pimeloyl-ACP methyl ester carboxylesterase
MLHNEQTSMTLHNGGVQRCVYLDTGGESTFVVHHPAAPTQRRDCAVVICPPFGWEELASHRSLRSWASALSQAGYATARLAYPGTGDSAGSPQDPGRLQAWIQAVSEVAAWLREQDGVPHVVALGVGFGGLVAQLAAARTDEVDGVVLWAAPARGREFVRQLRLFSRMETSEAFNGLDAPAPPESGGVYAGGFLLSSETMEDLSGVDLTTEAGTHDLALGALLLGRDDQQPAEALATSFAEQGTSVTIRPGRGYSTLTSHPQESQLPDEAAASVLDWLGERSERSELRSDGARPAPTAQDQLTLIQDGRTIVERPVAITAHGISLAGILTEPADDDRPALCAVFVNAGAIHRVGPNRNWVETARRWAATRGIASLRLDIEGLGDADGPDQAYVETERLYDPQMIEQISCALDALERDGVSRRFLLVGLCSGAYWAFHLALRDPRVVALQLLNPAVIEWDESLGPLRSLRAISRRSFANLRHAETRQRLRGTLRWMLRNLRQNLAGRGEQAPGPSVGERLESSLERLRASGKPTLMVFGEREPLYADLARRGWMERLESWPAVTVARLPVISHTLRPSLAQQQTRRATDEHLTTILAAQPGEGPAGSRLSAKMRRNPQQHRGGLRVTAPGSSPKNNR